MAALQLVEQDISPVAALPPGFVHDLTVQLHAGDVRLPSFPDIVVRLQRVLDDPSTSPTQVAYVVRADAALAARILRLANSVFMNPSGHVVTDLDVAITRLGHQLVRCTAVAFALQQMKFGGRSAELRPKLQALWRVGMLVAAIGYILARESRAARPEEAMLTGLMHNIGRLYITVNSTGGGADGERTEISAALMDEWHPRIAASILRHWKFPAPIVTAVGNQTTMERAPGIAIGLSNVLIAAIALVPGVFRRELVDEIATTVPAFQDLGLSADDCRRVLTASAQPIRSLQAALQG
jgi:HD-like signal output (HDOD) protein